jgi:hypothetical protein
MMQKRLICGLSGLTSLSKGLNELGIVMHGFEVGDLVFVFKNVSTTTTNLLHKMGVVKHLIPGEVGVEFSENIGGHDLHQGGDDAPAYCKHGHGWYMKADCLQKMEPFAACVQKEWAREWEPKLKKKEVIDPLILLEGKYAP